MPKTVTAIYAGTFTARDPETGAEVEMEVWKDPVSGAMLAIDGSYIEQVEDPVNSPYGKHKLEAPEND